MSERMTDHELATHIGHALYRIETQGRRGVSMVTLNEVEALAVFALLSGFEPLPLHEAYTKKESENAQ